MKKRVHWILAGVVMLLFWCGSVMAASSGTCGANGNNLTWKWDGNSTLTISGTGQMKNWYSTNSSPWLGQYVGVAKIEDGVTSIGSWAFSNTKYRDYYQNIWTDGYCNLSRITIPTSVTEIGDNAFYGCNYLKNVYYNGTNEQKAKISIGSGNDFLINATWHCIDDENHAYPDS